MNVDKDGEQTAKEKLVLANAVVKLVTNKSTQEYNVAPITPYSMVMVQEES